MTDLSGKTAVVTGASGGLGRHFALTLARHGARVVLAARRVEALELVAKEVEESDGSAIAVPLDVTDEEMIREVVATVEGEFGPIDILVNNSGVSVTKPVLEITASDWDYVLNVNLRAAFLLASEVARAMIAGGRGGSIINIASIVGLRPAGNLAPYAASKAGLIHLTRVMALELARHKIRVNAIAPGYFATSINEGFWDTDAGHAMMRRIPQRRLGAPQELDAPLLLLASDAGAYITGAVIPVDGGHLVSTL